MLHLIASFHFQSEKITLEFSMSLHGEKSMKSIYHFILISYHFHLYKKYTQNKQLKTKN